MLVGSWVIGDVLKGAYFRAVRAPPQFLACAIVQVGTDMFVLLQIFVLYAKPPPALNVHATLRGWLSRLAYVACVAPPAARREEEAV